MSWQLAVFEVDCSLMTQSVLVEVQSSFDVAVAALESIAILAADWLDLSAVVALDFVVEDRHSWRVATVLLMGYKKER